MKRILALALSLCLVLSLSMPTAWAAEFPDMPAEDHWSYEALTSAIENGLINGSDGMLNPGGTLTRAQMAAVINRAFGAIDMDDISEFTDVKSTDWFYKDIAKAVRMGTFKGNGTNLMNPDAPITREQVFTVLARAFKLEDGKAESLDAFADGKSVSDYAVGSVAALVEAGYVNGSNGMLLPQNTITREEFAQVIHKMISHYISEEGVYTENLTGNVMVNVPGVTLQNLVIEGDLIVGEGVGNGEITLDGVQLKGRLLVRGGGENSIVIKNSSEVGHVIISKTGDGGVRLYTEDGCEIEVVYIPDGKDDIILEGTFNQVSVATDAPIVLKDAEVSGLTVSAENATVETTGETSIAAVVIEESATGTTLTVGESTTIDQLDASAEGTSVSGDGTVVQATVSGNGSSIDTEGTTVTVGKDTEGVTVGGEELTPGETVDPTPPSNPIPEPLPPVLPDIPEEGDDDEPGTLAGETSVVSLEDLKAALKKYETVKITGYIKINSETLAVAKGQTLVIDSRLDFINSTLTVNGTVTNNFHFYAYGSTLAINGVFTNNSFMAMREGSKLLVAGTFVNAEYYNTQFSDTEITITEEGMLNLYAYTNVTGGKLTNNGKITVGKISDGYRSGNLDTCGCEIVNNGKMTLNSYTSVDIDRSEDIPVAGSFTNNGELVVSPTEQYYTSMSFYGATVLFKGPVSGNGYFSFNQSDVTFEGDDLFETSESISFQGGSLDVTKAGENTIRVRSLSFYDTYGDTDEICEVNLGDRSAFYDDAENDHYLNVHFNAAAYSEDAMRRAEAAQQARKAASDGTKFSGVYNYLDLYFELTLTEDTTFDDFGTYYLESTWYWDEDLQQNVRKQAKLTIEPGVTATFGVNSNLSGYSGIIENHGAIVFEQPEYWTRNVTVYLGDTGSYIGDGDLVNGILNIDFAEGTLALNEGAPYSSYTVALVGDNAYTVTQDTDIRTVYSIDDDTEIVVFGHQGELSGKALADARYTVTASSSAGLVAANKAEIYGEKVFDRVECRSDFTLDRDVTIEIPTYFNHLNTNLIIPYGRTLTIAAESYSHCSINVDGKLVITEDGYFSNYESLTVGALTGSEKGQILVYGTLYNGGYMHLYATGELLKCGNGMFRNNGELVEDKGSVNTFCNWSVIGNFWDTNWDYDLLMEQVDENTWISEVMYMDAGTEFKVRLNGSWNVNFGVEFNGANFVVEESGSYQVKLVWNGGEDGTVSLVPVD